MLLLLFVQLEEPLLDQVEVKMKDIQTSAMELEATTGSRSGANPQPLAKSVGGVSSGMTLTFDSRTLSEISSHTGKEGVAVGDPPAKASAATMIPCRPQVDLSFIRDAILELLKCRRVLKASYCYGYYLHGQVSPRQFEHMQVWK